MKRGMIVEGLFDSILLKERSIFTARKVSLFIMALMLCVGCGSMVAAGIDDHRVNVKIDRRVAIVRPTKGFDRAMLGMVHHPDGTIFVNTQTLGLYKSSDKGQKWKPSPVNFDSSVPTGQKLHGLGLSSDGKLWLLHQRHGAELFISNSMDGGRKWTTAVVDYANLAPGAPQKPFKSSDNDYNSFVELPDGTMMAAIELRYDNPEVTIGITTKWAAQSKSVDSTKPIIRSTDGGKTWGDPTLMHQFVAETSLAKDPNDPSHILAIHADSAGVTCRGERSRSTVMKRTGFPAASALRAKLENGHNGLTRTAYCWSRPIRRPFVQRSRRWTYRFL